MLRLPRRNLGDLSSGRCCSRNGEHAVKSASPESVWRVVVLKVARTLKSDAPIPLAFCVCARACVCVCVCMCACCVFVCVRALLGRSCSMGPVLVDSWVDGLSVGVDLSVCVCVCGE